MKKIFLILSVSVFLISCTKKNDLTIKSGQVQKNLPSFEYLFNYLNNNDIEGTFMVVSSTPLGFDDFTKISHPININGGFYSSKGSMVRKAGGVAKFENISISCNQDPSYNKDLTYDEGNSLFGKMLKISLIKPSELSNVVSDPAQYQSGYVPALFTCSNIFQDASYGSNGSYISGTKINTGYQFTWNIDTANQKGVFFYFEYDPSDPANNLVKANYPTKSSNAVLVDDNGAYSVAADMFTDIPLNSRINVYMGRANFAHLTDSAGNTTDIQFTAISYKYGSLFYGNQ